MLQLLFYNFWWAAFLCTLRIMEIQKEGKIQCVKTKDEVFEDSMPYLYTIDGWNAVNNAHVLQ